MESNTLSEKRAQSTKRILDAAAEVFSEVGYAGARVDEIARRAGINKAMIYYRIGDKQVLYEQVLHDIFEKLAMQIARNLKDVQTPEEKLKMFIRNILRAMDRRPHFAPIMMRELASGTRVFPETVGQYVARIIGTLAEILKDGETKKVFTKTNPFLLHMMIVGTGVFYRMSGPIRSSQTIIPESFRKLDETVSKDIGKEIERIILNGIRKQGPGSGQTVS